MPKGWQLPRKIIESDVLKSLNDFEKEIDKLKNAVEEFEARANKPPVDKSLTSLAFYNPN